MRLADIVLFHLEVIVAALFNHLRKPKIKSILSAVFLAMPVFIYIIASDNVIGTAKLQMQTPILVIDAGHGLTAEHLLQTAPKKAILIWPLP